MKLRNLTLALFFLDLRNLKAYFSIKIIIFAFIGALSLSNFIYLSLFDSKILEFSSPFLTIFGISTIIRLSKFGFFCAGFFTGVLWFYWISFSFIYYDLFFMMPFVVLGIGLIYGFLFLIPSYFSFVGLRAIVLFLVSYIKPFGFDWLNLEATLVLGIFSPDERGLIAIFLSAYFLNFKKFYKFFALIPLMFGIQFSTHMPFFVPFDVELSQTDILQFEKWDKNLKNEFINENLELISKAILENKRVIILPESAFPTVLARERFLLEELKNLSFKIAIVAGSLHYEDSKIYNSAYLFDKGKIYRFDKFILVPFGEEIPLPNFLKQWINKLFFDGASDYAAASGVSDYEIDGVKIRNAICFEATSKKIYENSPGIVFAITNNGWFKYKNINSTEPILQNLLLKYFATKYKTTIYHSVNGSKSQIITPKKAWFEFDSFKQR